MRISPVVCHKAFGHLTKVYGQYSFGIAPHEQKAFKGFGEGLVKMFKHEFLRLAHVWALNITGFYLLYDYSKKKYAVLERKHPQDFVNED